MHAMHQTLLYEPLFVCRAGTSVPSTAHSSAEAGTGDSLTMFSVSVLVFMPLSTPDGERVAEGIYLADWDDASEFWFRQSLYVTIKFF